MEYTKVKGATSETETKQKKKNNSNLKKFKLFIKSIKCKVIKSKKLGEDIKTKHNHQQASPLKYSRNGTSHSSFHANSITIKPLKQARPGHT